MIDTQTMTDIRIERTTNSKISSFDSSNLQFGREFADHMFCVDYDGEKWVDARVVPYGNIQLDPATSLIHYGQSIFEGLKGFKTDDGEVLVFRPDENARRLNFSAQRMCMPNLPEKIFLDAIRVLLDLDRDWIPTEDNCSMYIRPFMFATDVFLGVRPARNYRFMIINSPSGPYYSKPVRVKVERQYSRSASGGVGAAKAAGNYAASLYPAARAQAAGFDQLVWTDAATHTYIEESGTMNIMFQIDDCLVTPPVSDTILPGITRASVVSLARDWDIDVQERRVSVDEIVRAHREGRLKDAFGVGTAATIAAISSITVDDEELTLPDVSQREYSNRLGTYLSRLKLGLEPDTRNWLMRV